MTDGDAEEAPAKLDVPDDAYVAGFAAVSTVALTAAATLGVFPFYAV